MFQMQSLLGWYSSGNPGVLKRPEEPERLKRHFGSEEDFLAARGLVEAVVAVGEAVVAVAVAVEAVVPSSSSVFFSLSSP